MIRLTLTDEQHNKVNRFRNNLNLWIGYVVTVLVGISGLLVLATLVTRAAIALI